MTELQGVSPPAGVDETDGCDWGWQMRNRVRTAEQLSRYVTPTDDEARAIEALGARFRFVITPYYARLMDPRDPGCPIRRQVVPTIASSG